MHSIQLNVWFLQVLKDKNSKDECSKCNTHLKWTFKVRTEVNIFRQIPHLYSRFPVWLFKCDINVDLSENAWPHCLHYNVNLNVSHLTWNKNNDISDIYLLKSYENQKTLWFSVFVGMHLLRVFVYNLISIAKKLA